MKRCTVVRRPRASLLLAPLLLLAACAAEQPAPPPQPPSVAEHTPTPKPVPPPAARPAVKVEESAVGEAPGLTPGPQVLAAIPTPAPQMPSPVVPAPATSATPAAATEPDSLLTHITKSTPPNVAAALRLIEDGRDLLAKGRYDQALDRFERSVAIDPSNAYGYYFLAQLHYQTKKYDQAVAFASRAAALSSRTDRAWEARCYSLQGAVFEEVGRFADARKAYKRAVDADPANPTARTGYARLNGK